MLCLLGFRQMCENFVITFEPLIQSFYLENKSRLLLNVCLYKLYCMCSQKCSFLELRWVVATCRGVNVIINITNSVFFRHAHDKNLILQFLDQARKVKISLLAKGKFQFRPPAETTCCSLLSELGVQVNNSIWLLQKIPGCSFVLSLSFSLSVPSSLLHS